MPNLPALLVSLVLGAVICSEARAWGLHYLVTDRALEHASMKALDAPVKAVPLEAFLEGAKAELPKLFDDYYAWLAERGSKRFSRMTFDSGKPTRETFLRAARLNPKTPFHVLRRLLPHEQPAPGTRVLGLKDLGADEKESAAFPFRLVDVTGQEVSARSVLVTFADEPDWFMDQELFQYTEYGYGKQPYGLATGTSSRAPFHMLFARENFVVRTFAGEVTEGMMRDRVSLFMRLSKLAFDKGNGYWGYRFLAWATHYVQDLAQPYHARAVPFGDWLYYAKFVISTEKARIKKETTQLAQNRHFAYEDFVAYSLQQSYLEKNELFTKLGGFLSAGDEVDAGAVDALALIERVADHATGHAASIDATVSLVFGQKVANDPAYDLEKDPDYQIRKVIDAMTPEAGGRLLTETGKDFQVAGQATRTLVRLQGKP